MPATSGSATLGGYHGHQQRLPALVVEQQARLVASVVPEPRQSGAIGEALDRNPRMNALDRCRER
jgi:hypothetical protein